MFCNGQCRKKDKKCGLLEEMAHYGPNGAKVPGSEFDRCVFGAILDSIGTLSKDNIRIQAAVEHSRNQQNTDELESRKAIAHGFVGLIHTFQNNPEGVKNAGLSKQKLIKMVELTEAKQVEIAEEQVRIASGDK